jgi:hypothetical protein
MLVGTPAIVLNVTMGKNLLPLFPAKSRET